jgi:hypothetical protein
MRVADAAERRPTDLPCSKGTSGRSPWTSRSDCLVTKAQKTHEAALADSNDAILLALAALSPEKQLVQPVKVRGVACSFGSATGM